MSKLKQILIILPIGLVLAGLTVLFFLIEPSFTPDLYHLTSMIIVALWAFFLFPSLLLGAEAVKRYTKDHTSEQAAQANFRFGMVFGYGGGFVLCLLLSPITGSIWYILAVKESVVCRAKKNPPEEKDDSSDVFGL